MTKQEVKKTVEDAKDLIERGWCQGDFAKDAKGDGCDSSDEEATEFCLIGVINKVTKCSGPTAGFNGMAWRLNSKIRNVLRKAIGASSGEDLDTWNDSEERTQGEVVDLFSKVIKGLEVE